MFKEKQSKEISKLAENETWIQNLEELKQIKEENNLKIEKSRFEPVVIKLAEEEIMEKYEMEVQAAKEAEIEDEQKVKQIEVDAQ